jgi:curved DNA-binding protein CbpA
MTDHAQTLYWQIRTEKGYRCILAEVYIDCGGTMKKPNPYDVLSVSRGATESEIKEAAKQHARETHPDAGGDPDEFNAGRRALAILSDPKRRRKLDAAGDAEEAKPDTTASRAMGCIENELSEFVDKFLASGFDPSSDPRKINVIAAIEASLRGKLVDEKTAIANANRHLTFIRDFAKRFTKKKDRARSDNEKFDFIARRFENQIAQTKDHIEQIEEAIAGREMAIAMLQTYVFRKDMPPMGS